MNPEMNREVRGQFFVATDGNDSWSGTLPEPNAQRTDGPFATLARARAAVRELKVSDGLREPVTVMVRGGKYYLENTLILNTADSGTQECRIAYTAYPGEKPVLSGGKRLTGWQPYQGKILRCDVPEAKGGKWKFRQLFFNGERQVRARYPNYDPDNPLDGGWLRMGEPAQPGSFTAFKYDPDTFKRRWAKFSEAEALIVNDWGVTSIIPIKTVDEGNRTITLVDGVQDFNVLPWFISTPLGPEYDYRYRVENVLEELDQPGEWCLDWQEGKAYFWPPTDEIAEAEVTAPVLDCLLDIRNASWLTISGFTFTETANAGCNMHRAGHDGYGAQFPAGDHKYCGEALHMRGAEHCCIERNYFCAVGGNGIYAEDRNLRNVIRHNEISHAGHCGVVLIGTKYLLHGPRHPIYNKVEDNHIHHCGVFNKYVAGIFLGVSDGNTIGHNLVEDMPHHAINLGNSGYGRNIVEYNEIRRVCLETRDNGAINCWMEDPHNHPGKDAERSGHIIRCNFIADLPVGGEKSHTKGIYLDNFTANCMVCGNIIVRAGRPGGIHTNDGRNNVIENNIIVDCATEAFGTGGPHYFFAPHMSGYMAGNRICRNIFYRSKSQDAWYLFSTFWYDRIIGESDHNVFFNADSGEYTVGVQRSPEGDYEFSPFEKWQEMGFDQNSIFADPLFVDAESDDYRLQPESPALKLGFQPIDVANIGIREEKAE